MKHRLPGKLHLVLGVFALLACHPLLSKPVSEESRSVIDSSISAACSSEIDLSIAVKKLSSGDWAEADQTRKLLLHYSRQSLGCRKEIIDALIQAMNKPPLNFVYDQRSYFLWSNGSAILGELKAVDALDLLIDHLDLNDGEFSASMTHQPAVLGVKEMGVLAIPKLTLALRNNSNRNIRLAAALCLNVIGGRSAMQSLKRALNSESDQCVRRFIQISLEVLKNKHRQASASKELDLPRQLLMAFKCDN